MIYMNKKQITKTNADVAKTLCARDWKGFGTGYDTMNAVVTYEHKGKERN